MAIYLHQAKWTLNFKKFIRDKGGQYILIKGGITMIKIYVPNNKLSKYMKQKLTKLKREIILQ